jgi:predicted anti-sigma-YlaC factor YlaD
MIAITCREVVEIVTDYLEGALPPDVLARLEEHLSVCDPCREYIAQVRTTTRLAARTRALEERPDRDALLEVFREFKRAG